MNKEQIEAVLETLRVAHCNLDFPEFCRRTGFQGSYALEKKNDFHRAVRELTAFDAGTLALLLEGFGPLTWPPGDPDSAG